MCATLHRETESLWACYHAWRNRITMGVLPCMEKQNHYGRATMHRETESPWACYHGSRNRITMGVPPCIEKQNHHGRATMHQETESPWACYHGSRNSSCGRALKNMESSGTNCDGWTLVRQVNANKDP